jgi:hypothetical protein
MSQRVAEMPLNDFRRLYTIYKTWRGTESWVNIDITDGVDVAADEFHEAVDKLGRDLDGGVRIRQNINGARELTSVTP